MCENPYQLLLSFGSWKPTIQIQHSLLLWARLSAKRVKCAHMGTDTTPSSSEKKQKKQRGISADAREGVLCYRGVVNNFVCHLLQTQRGRSHRCSGICSWLCFSCFEVCVSWSKSCLVRNPSDRPRPTLPLHAARMRMCEPVFWLEYQAKTPITSLCNWQRLPNISTMKVVTWELHETLRWIKLETVSIYLWFGCQP